MSYLIDNLARGAIVSCLTKGQRKAVRKMTAIWQHGSGRTFTHQGAYFTWLSFTQKSVPGIGPIVEMKHIPDGKRQRAAFRLTPLGLELKEHMIEKDLH